MTSADLDTVVLGGCADPSCDHKGHDPLYLHSRCHINSPFFLSRDGGKVIATCADPYCDHKVVVELDAPSGEPAHRTVYRQPCHPDSAVWLAYSFGSGVVQVVCFECGQRVMDIPLAGP